MPEPGVTNGPNPPSPRAPSLETPRRPLEMDKSGILLQEPLHHPAAHEYTPLELWTHRIAVLLFVFVCAAVGILLVILPWLPQWTDNRLLLGIPFWRSVVASGFVRGLCSGLGVLDIWIGFLEAVYYHEEKPGT
jgi:hypothetical protein